MSIFFKKKNPKTGDTWEAAYGMVPMRDVAVDEALGDAALTEAARAARQGDWKPAAEALTSVGSEWDRRMLQVSVLGRVSLENTAWLDGWLAAEPDSPHAAVVRASSLLDQAGRARGGAYAKHTPREQLEAFARINAEADEAARRAVALAPEDPTPWVCRMSAAMGERIFHEQFTGLWNQAFSRAPMHRRAHSYAHQYWLAKWYGSEELSAKFVADAVARAPRTPLAFELSVHRAMESWVVFRSTGKMVTTARAYFQAGGRDYIAAALEQWDGELPTGGPLETVDRNLLAWTLTMAGRYDEACDVFEAIGGRACFGFPWHYDRDPMESFGRVRRWAIEGSQRKPVKGK